MCSVSGETDGAFGVMLTHVVHLYKFKRPLKILHESLALFCNSRFSTQGTSEILVALMLILLICVSRLLTFRETFRNL